MLRVSAEEPERRRREAGNEVDVDIELDDDPREVTPPPAFSDALDGDRDARGFFEGLSYRHQLRSVPSMEGARTAETRRRRTTPAVSMLAEGRTWRSGARGQQPKRTAATQVRGHGPFFRSGCYSSC
jgi:Bacteriocin-protection, YdeI or OmpD-Associated